AAARPAGERAAKAQAARERALSSAQQCAWAPQGHASLAAWRSARACAPRVSRRRRRSSAEWFARAPRRRLERSARRRPQGSRRGGCECIDGAAWLFTPIRPKLGRARTPAHFAARARKLEGDGRKFRAKARTARQAKPRLTQQPVRLGRDARWLARGP